MFCDIKYDGERVQVHKQGKEFRYFSRSLKAVVPHKVGEVIFKPLFSMGLAIANLFPLSVLRTNLLLC